MTNKFSIGTSCKFGSTINHSRTLKNMINNHKLQYILKQHEPTIIIDPVIDPVIEPIIEPSVIIEPVIIDSSENEPANSLSIEPDLLKMLNSLKAKKLTKSISKKWT